MQKIGREEFDKGCNFISSKAFLHTDFVVSGIVTSSQYEIKGFGSCVLVRYKKREYVITCDHVLGTNNLFFSGANKLEKNKRIDTQKNAKLRNLSIAVRDGSIDIAILTGYPHEENTRKEFYDIEKSRFFNETIANQNQGALCCFIGAVGEHTCFGPWNDLVYADVCYVKACSGLAPMCNGNLMGDFAAKEITEKRDNIFPSLKSLVPTGGELNFKGCSGCGLWGINGTEVFLLGILLGKEPGNPATEHKIRFTPVWKILEMLESLPL